MKKEKLKSKKLFLNKQVVTILDKRALSYANGGGDIPKILPDSESLNCQNSTNPRCGATN
jgi:hypothetical protein